MRQRGVLRRRRTHATLTAGASIMETVQAIPEWRTAADEIWAILRDTDKLVKENSQQMKETDKRMKETDKQIKETGKLIEHNAKEIENLKKTVERVTKNVGGLNRSMGELVETLIAARLWEKFPKYNLKRAYQRVPIFDEKNRIMTDIDILLSNTIRAMIVEVKHELNKMKDVDGHLKRMELVRKYPPAEVAGKELLGAMAGGVVDPDVRHYAYENGLFVLELTGETVDLIPPPDGFIPKKW
jgi:chromosome segregation ATPase